MPTNELSIRRERLKRFLPVLACPTCKGDLKLNETEVSCKFCAVNYPIRQGRLYFSEPPSRDDTLDTTKLSLRKMLGPFYHTLVGILGPTRLPNYQKILHSYSDPAHRLVVDCGSGDRRLHPDCLCLDWHDYSEVDLVCKLPLFPFKPGSLDCVTAWNMFEQLGNPQDSASEMIKSLKPDGSILVEIPFVMPFHAGPEDHQRFSHQGAAALIEPCKVVEQWSASGPLSLLTFISAELISVLFSFGFKRPRDWLFLLICTLLSPLKYLDVFFAKRQSLIGIAPAIITVGKKPASASSNILALGDIKR